MSLCERLAAHAQAQPDKTAIDFEGEQLTYFQLQRLVERCAKYFQEQNLSAGDRVAILALNHPDWFITVFAAEREGLLLVPLNWRLSVGELQFVMDDCAPRLLLHDQALADVADQLVNATAGLMKQEIGHADFPPTIATKPAEAIKQTFDQQSQASLTQDLLIVYTSGTTGRPKGAVLSNAALACSARMSEHMLNMQPTDRVLNLLPLFHVGGLNIQPLPALLLGATLILHARFDPEAALLSIENDRISLLTVVPTVLQALMDNSNWASANLTSLRALSIGSSDVPVAQLQAMKARDVPVLQVYGATETSPTAIYQRLGCTEILGSIGQAGLLCDIKLIDNNGERVAVGKCGEIQVKGENILSRYWNNEAATRDSIKEGWFSTGDVAHQDKNGNYWFDERLKHVVISGGENIYPAELERLIRQAPGIDEVAVVGLQDNRWGEVPVAVVVSNQNVSPQVVYNACCDLAAFKQPKDVIFVKALPRNALGKVQIHRLKEQVNAQR